MESYLELKQYKWIIMLMDQFRFKIWWQAVFPDDHCCCITAALAQVLCAYVGLYVHIIWRCQTFCLEATWIHVCVCRFWVNWLWTFGSSDVCILSVSLSPWAQFYIYSQHVNVVRGTPALTSLPSQDSVTMCVLPQSKQHGFLCLFNSAAISIIIHTGLNAVYALFLSITCPVRSSISCSLFPAFAPQKLRCSAPTQPT